MAKRLSLATVRASAAVALVTGAVYALRPVAPVLSLGVLYLFAVLPVAALWGLRFAAGVSVVSMLAFNWLFLPPTHTFHLRRVGELGRARGLSGHRGERERARRRVPPPRG